jgi:hypothetical protein
MVPTLSAACDWIDTELTLAMEHISAKYRDTPISLYRQAVDPCVSTLPAMIHQLQERTRERYSELVEQYQREHDSRRSSRRNRRARKSKSDANITEASLQESTADPERDEEDPRQELWTQVQGSMVCLLWLQDQQAQGENSPICPGDEVYDEDGNQIECASTVLTIAEEKQELLKRVLKAKSNGVWLDMSCLQSTTDMDRLVEYTGPAPRRQLEYERIVAHPDISESKDDREVMETSWEEQKMLIDPRNQVCASDEECSPGSSAGSPNSSIEEETVILSADIGVA